jgi:hypothetical protein
MKRIVRLTESDLTRIVKQVINENTEDFKKECENIKELTGSVWMFMNQCVDSDTPEDLYKKNVLENSKKLITALQKLNSTIPTTQQPISDIPNKPDSSTT